MDCCQTKTNGKFKMKKTYNVHYSFYLSESREVEAESEREAIKIVENMIENGELGNLNEMSIAEQKVWTD